MKVTARVEKEFEVVAIRVMAEVRYWEDSIVNGVEDSDGTLIPFRFECCWAPTIDLDTGRVRDWPEGMVADIHYKVCDQGVYDLIDVDGNSVATRDNYVPDMLAVGDNGYGDYIIMKIGPNGLIEGWQEPEIDPDDWEWRPGE